MLDFGGICTLVCGGIPIWGECSYLSRESSVTQQMSSTGFKPLHFFLSGDLELTGDLLAFASLVVGLKAICHHV